MTEVTERSVQAIENGTVIDHINPEATLKVLQILNLKEDIITMGNHLPSKKLGTKGVIKIANKELSKQELNKIALISPHATVCVIKKYNVTKKFEVELPNEVSKVMQCFNPNCITRNQDIDTCFDIIQKEPLKVKCYYCETVFGNITLK